jgi:preprotein translocase subunit YajC
MEKRKFPNIMVALVLLATFSLVAGCSSTNTSNASASSSSGTWLLLIIFIAVIFGFMYFFTVRPQQKKQQEKLKMLQSLQIGDMVITNGGIYGKIQNIYSESFIIKTDSGDTMRVAKWAVIGKQSGEPGKTD